MNLITTHPKSLYFTFTEAAVLGQLRQQSRQLRSKNRLTGTGWKMMKESKLDHFVKESFHKSLCFKKSLSRKKRTSSRKKKKLVRSKGSALNETVSWKFRKKKLILTRRSPLKETVSWKPRKKKASLSARLQFTHVQKGPSLRKVCTWKRKKKRR